MNQEPMTLSDRLSDCLPKVGEPEAQFCVVDTSDLRMVLDGLAQYLKDDETPAQRIERERRDTGAALKLLAREKLKTERLEDMLKRMLEAPVMQISVSWKHAIRQAFEEEKP